MNGKMREERDREVAVKKLIFFCLFPGEWEDEKKTSNRAEKKIAKPQKKNKIIKQPTSLF